MKKILIFISVSFLLVLSIFTLWSSRTDIVLFFRYIASDESAASIQSNWRILYTSIAYLALSVVGIVFSSVFFIKQLLKEKARKKMQDLQEKLQKESTE